MQLAWGAQGGTRVPAGHTEVLLRAEPWHEVTVCKGTWYCSIWRSEQRGTLNLKPLGRMEGEFWVQKRCHRAVKKAHFLSSDFHPWMKFNFSSLPIGIADLQKLVTSSAVRLGS